MDFVDADSDVPAAEVGSSDEDEVSIDEGLKRGSVVILKILR